ncbi:MAG TPA: hypothetical protein DCL61_17750 [Cyanobacteria bacterium UBA12227]|nr:hypothetical protein [Cyanobacteria bacterium UBA12227]HAX86626.1 hypothetical protein [Cyanobacteria bacterium UBA11370]HBY80031.1 hypothetical protein [Cyanobacteria bacterium UBA11148]
MRQCADCAKQQQEHSPEEGKEFDPESLTASGIQTKLTVGAPGDVYEQEADRVAAQVMSMPDHSPQVQRFAQGDNSVQMKSLAQSITPLVQRRVDESVQMRSIVQRVFQAGGTETNGDLESSLNTSKGGGSPLAPSIRAFMEPRFGADFSAVRVHTGGEAVQMNRELGAQAFTHGSDVYFGAGKEPGNNELTAHELTHVVQQGGGVQRRDSKQENITINSQEIKSAQMGIQRRGLTDQEQNIMNRLEKFASLAKKENHVPYSGSQFAANVKTAKANLLNDIGAVPRGTEDPERLLATLWSLHIWATDPSSYAKAVAIPNNGLNVRDFPANSYKCNRFVGDAYAVGARAGYGIHGRGGSFPTGKPGFLDLRPGYPVSANELASTNPAEGSLTNLPVTQDPQIGDIISFPSTGIAHTGINLGNNVYISARNSPNRPVWAMQPEDGVQITKIPEQEHGYREFQPPRRVSEYVPNPHHQFDIVPE